MKHVFTYAGQERTLAKHPKVQAALKAGTITEAEARTKPWYLRFTFKGKPCSKKLSANDRDAEKGAKDELRAIANEPEGYAAYKKLEAARLTITVGQLNEAWNAVGNAKSQTTPRTESAAACVRASVRYALPWWKDVPVGTINAVMLANYAAYRSPRLRSADAELAALSCLGTWAVLTGRLERNPFMPRPRFSKCKHHCHQAMPRSDEELHRVLAWCWDRPVPPVSGPATWPTTFKEKCPTEIIIVGAYFAFQALTGLRPGEPRLLRRLPPLAAPPGDIVSLPPGTIFPDRKGQLRMKIQRLKGGQNPAIVLHPALLEFLSAWRAWLARNTPDATHLFTLTCDQSKLNRVLNDACEALEIPRLIPHGFRAFYTRVQRSNELDDSTIAAQLGQTTNGQLIRSTYGNPNDQLGGALFDWLPDDCAPAWNLLAQNQNSKQHTEAAAQPDASAITLPLS